MNKVVVVMDSARKLMSVQTSRKIDEQAQKEWGFNTFALIESVAGSCARVFQGTYPQFFDNHIPRILVFAGSGNNGADALGMLRYWLLQGSALAETSKVIVSCASDEALSDETSPFSCLYVSLREMQVPVSEWQDSLSKEDISEYDIILDGITGTGARSPLTGRLGEMVETINALIASLAKEKNIYKIPLVVSVDMPSGLSDEWKPGMPIINSDVTLAIEPQKRCLYTPASRVFSGTILPVDNIFPKELINSYKESELFDWDTAQKIFPPLRHDIHKYQRGTVEIHAGSLGSTGAAIIAGRGAQAAGAGLVRLIVDKEIYPITASQAGGIMVSPAESNSSSNRFVPDAILLGPGWGKGPGRHARLEQALQEEKNGTSLVLDADAIALAKETIFHGNCLLTPHIGEFAAFTGAAVEEIETQPFPLLTKIAHEKNAFILLKSHVMMIAAPDGRVGVVDGMSPNLAVGGSGDLLAGLCAALAARQKKEGHIDLYLCAAVAASLFTRAAENMAARFIDPMELADQVADLAGKAWLPVGLKASF